MNQISHMFSQSKKINFIDCKRGVAIFAKAFLGIPAQQAAKITRPLMPSAAPAVLLIGSEEAAASVCPQNRAYGSVYGSSCKAYPLRNFKPMRQLAVGSYFLPFQVNKPAVGISSRHRSGV